MAGDIRILFIKKIKRHICGDCDVSFGSEYQLYAYRRASYYSQELNCFILQENFQLSK